MCFSRKVPVLATLLMASVLLPAFAAAPANDSFSAPTIVVGFPATATGSNVDATLQAGESIPVDWDDSAEASVWFRWTSTTSGFVRIDTVGSAFDTMLAVWTGTVVNALTLLAENDQYGGDQSAVFVPVSLGVTYRIGVYGWNDARGAIALHITNDTTSKILGTVTNGPTPLEGIQVTAYRWNDDWGYWESVSSADSDASGHYTISGLDPGTYRVRFRDWDGNFVAECYDNAPDLASAMDIGVPPSSTVSNINAALAVASKISGTVTGPNGTPPLEGIWAEAYHWNGSGWDWISNDSTDDSGHYTIGGLTSGTYRVEFYGGDGNYLPQAYSNAVDLDSGTDIAVPASSTVSNINAALAVASKISGTVTGPNGTPPLENIQVTAYQQVEDGWAGPSVWTDANGQYSIGGLAAGIFRVEFRDNVGNYVSEVYSNAPDLDAGMDIAVSAGMTVSNINAALATYSGISGTVTDGVAPLGNIQVTAYQWNDDFSDWDWSRTTYSDASGNYTIRGLAAGTYRVRFYDYNGYHLSEAYSNAPSLDAGTDIAVPAHTTVSNINAALAMASGISGTVTDGVAPLEDIQVTAYQWNDDFSDWEGSGTDYSDASGNYTIRGLTEGVYRVQFYDDNGYHLSEAYSNAPSLDAGTDIAVSAHTTVSNINASLATASGISGTVTDGVAPLEDIRVTAYQWNDEFSYWAGKGSAYSDAGGNYTIRGLAAGNYRVNFYDDNEYYLSGAYSNAPSLDAGTDIAVPAGTTVSNINAALTTYSGISGTVTDGVAPLEDIWVTACQWDDDFSYWEGKGSAYSDAGGNYTIRGLTAGTYRVSFYDGNGEYLFEAYSNAPSLDAGTDIAVPAGTTVSNINEALATFSKISGHVTDGFVPLEGIRVTAYQWDDDLWDWDGIGSAYSDADGNYTIEWLVPGTYRVRFYDFDGNYLSEAYSNAPSLDAGTDIAVSAGTTVSNINAALAMSSGISGTITDGFVPLEGIRVAAYQWNDEFSYWDQKSSAGSDASGNYTIRGLTPGIYRAKFWDNNGDYITEAYSNAPTLGAGMDITVPASTTVSNINADLAAYSTISGIVTGLDGSVPLQGARVDAYLWITEIAGWEFIQSAWTDSNGYYSLRGLSSGTCRVWFASSSGNYLSEAYNDAPTVNTGLDVPVPAGTAVSGINASLAASGSYPSEVVGIRKVGTDMYDLSMTGSLDRLYMLQWAPSLTGSWVNTGESFYSGSDTNVIPMTPTGTAGFWRVILAP